MDFCPRCRIQAPHDARRSGCPRCGGPLMVVDDPSRIPPPGPVAPRGPAPRPRVPTGPPRPASRRPDRRVRWLAQRPPEARPGPRRRPQSGAAGPTPRYSWIPRWGLVDEIAPESQPTSGRNERSAQQLVTLLAALAVTLLAATAMVQAWIYGLLIVNRTEPLNGTLVLLSYAAAWGFGVVSILMVIACLAAFANWLSVHRRRAYAENDRIDPRPEWHLFVGCLVPVLNMVAPAVFLHELASCGHQLPADRLVRTLRLWWAGWVALNLMVAITLTIRYSADSIQWGANAVLLTVLCDAAGAVFAFVSLRLLHRTFDPAARPEPATRWLAV